MKHIKKIFEAKGYDMEDIQNCLNVLVDDGWSIEYENFIKVKSIKGLGVKIDPKSVNDQGLFKPIRNIKYLKINVYKRVSGFNMEGCVLAYGWWNSESTLLVEFGIR